MIFDHIFNSLFFPFLFLCVYQGGGYQGDVCDRCFCEGDKGLFKYHVIRFGPSPDPPPPPL